MAAEYEERLRGIEDAHVADLEAAENAYQEEIMAEVDAYQALIAERNAEQARWAEARRSGAALHKRLVAELGEDFEARLDEDQALREQLGAERGEAAREFAEMRAQLEDDVDAEIENIRDR